VFAQQIRIYDPAMSNIEQNHFDDGCNIQNVFARCPNRGRLCEHFEDAPRIMTLILVDTSSWTSFSGIISQTEAGAVHPTMAEEV
jgi:hypothetical protein